MAFRITDECIDCQACLEVCAYQAIRRTQAADGARRLVLVPSACTHCWPFAPRPKCVNVCPVNCIVVDPDQPVPPIHLIREELEAVLRIAGPFEAGRIIRGLRQWVRAWFVDVTCSESTDISVDKVLDFDSTLRLLERELAPSSAPIGPAPARPS